MRFYKLSLTNTGVPAAKAAGTPKLPNRLFHILGKDYFMFCGFITAHSHFKNVPLRNHVSDKSNCAPHGIHLPIPLICV